MNCPKCDEILKFYYEGDQHNPVDYWYCPTCGHDSRFDVVDDSHDGEYDNLPMPSLNDLGDMVVIEEKEKPKRKNDDFKQMFGFAIAAAFVLSLVFLAMMFFNTKPETYDEAVRYAQVLNFFNDLRPLVDTIAIPTLMLGIIFGALKVAGVLIGHILDEANKGE